MSDLTTNNINNRLILSGCFVAAFVTTNLPSSVMGFDSTNGRNSRNIYSTLSEWKLNGYDRSESNVTLGTAKDKIKNGDIERAVFSYQTKRVKVRVKKVTNLSSFRKLNEKAVGREALL